MTENDWEKWNDDPEEWLVENLESSQAWSYDLRVRLNRLSTVDLTLISVLIQPCAERVLLSLNAASRGRNVMEPLVLQKLQDSLSVPATDMASRVKQDAVLCALGRMSLAMMNHVKLDQVLSLLSTAVGSSHEESVGHSAAHMAIQLRKLTRSIMLLGTEYSRPELPG